MFRQSEIPRPHEVVVDTLEGPDTSLRDGRVFGGIVLAAFFLYGVGSTLIDQPIGMALVLVNSAAVAYAGVIGFGVVGSERSNAGRGYLAGRVAEALLLGGGAILSQQADFSGADTTGYLLAMTALGVGSIPFLRLLRTGRRIPRALATWGIYGYAALVVGALIELVTSQPVTVFFAIPGGLFELALGLYLLRKGFARPTTKPETKA